MLLTIACMLPSALARLPVSFMTNEFILSGLYVFVLTCVGVDTLAPPPAASGVWLGRACGPCGLAAGVLFHGDRDMDRASASGWIS